MILTQNICYFSISYSNSNDDYLFLLAVLCVYFYFVCSNCVLFHFVEWTQIFTKCKQEAIYFLLSRLIFLFLFLTLSLYFFFLLFFFWNETALFLADTHTHRANFTVCYLLDFVCVQLNVIISIFVN